jgi:hypothetical protein
LVTPFNKFKNIELNVDLEKHTDQIKLAERGDYEYIIKASINDQEINANGSLQLETQKFEGFLSTTFEKYRYVMII